MDPWSVGLATLVVVGLVAVVFGAAWDRARNRRRAAEMLAPPDRAIPRMRRDAPAPHYLSELQARRQPSGPDESLAPDERAALAQQLDDAETLTVDAGFASSDFVTDQAAGWAVLDDAAVLVCADPVASIRELLGVLEPMMLSRTPLVVVAPDMARDVLATLEVNRIQRRLAVLVVLDGEAATRDALAQSCGATPTQRSDRQAGYLPPEALGHVARWVSTARSSHLVSRRTAPT